MAQFAEYLPQLLLAWSIQWMGILSPGPGVALILGVATAHGRAAAINTVGGIAAAAMLWSLATVLGLAALFAQMADLMLVVRLIGATYLAWLAYRAFKTAVNLPPLDLTAGPAARTGAAMTGFMMQIANPKAIFFWLAIAAAGGIGQAPWPVVALFVVGAFVNSFVGHGAYAVVLSSTPFRVAYSRARRWVEATLGVFFTLFAFKLATDRG